MRLVLVFLGAVMLVFSMANHAHADTAREDDEGLRASKAESSSLSLAHRDSTQGDEEIEAAVDEANDAEVIDNTRRKKRRVFIGVSIESGTTTLSAARDTDNYNYNYGPIVGWSLEIGRDPFAIELGQEKLFNRTPTEEIVVISSLGSPATIGRTGMYVSFIRLKRRIVRLKQLHVWIGIGIDYSITKNKWIFMDDSRRSWNRTDELGVHLQGSFLVKKWSNSELSVDIRSRDVGDMEVFRPANYSAPSSHKTRSVSVKWTYLLYESPREVR